jgi:hypothetical protein
MKKEATDKYTKEVLLYFSFDFLKTWDNEINNLNENKNGRKYVYPNSLIEFCGKIKFLFGVGWRQVKGILLALKKWIPIPNVPSKSRVNERFNLLNFDLEDNLIVEDSQNIALDSSGLKINFSGQWVRDKHHEKRPYLKLHVAVNTKTKQAIAMELTDDGIADVSCARKLILKSEKISKVKKGFMDGAYDEIALWNWCEKKGIEPRIRLRKNAKTHGLNERSKQAKRMKEIGMKEWKKEREMGERVHVEGFYSAFKRRFGEFFWARKIKNMIQEIKFKIILCNQLISN